MTTHGTADPAFTRLQTLLSERLTSGAELGASICVNIAGRNVLDIWGGHADTAKTTPWQENTLVVVWSCTKVVTALAAAILIDRGQLDPEAPVSKYWPEFAANGKQDTKIWHLLAHSSGLPQWDKPIKMEDIYDTKESTERLAKQKPWYQAGEMSAYQLINHGHLIGEVVRRVSGKSLKEFIKDEIAGPLGADFRLGLPEEEWGRAAEVVAPPAVGLPKGLDEESVVVRALGNLVTRAEDSETAGFRGCEIGGANGFGNARSLARIGSVVSLKGTVEGREYLSPRTVREMMKERISGADLVLFLNIRFGLGVALPVPESIDFVPEGNICFWGGWGGSMLIMDLDRGMTIAYTMNKMGQGILGNENAKAYLDAIYEIVGSKGPTASL
jgi:CubicO group peptidase (beta-lactamase class C family)